MKSKSNGEERNKDYFKSDGISFGGRYMVHSKSGAHDQGYLSAEELITEKQKQKKQSSDKTEEKK